MNIKLEWDENKNEANIQRHGIDFEDAHIIFSHPMLIKEDTRKDYGKKRMVGLGLLHNDVVVVTVFTRRITAIRVISIRRANRNERKIYQEKFPQQD